MTFLIVAKLAGVLSIVMLAAIIMSRKYHADTLDALDIIAIPGILIIAWTLANDIRNTWGR